MSERISGTESIINEERLIEVTREILSKLTEEEQNGLVYAVMGGVAVEASGKGIYRPLRNNGTTRDIDVMVLDDPSGSVTRIRTWMREKGFDDGKRNPRLSMKVVREEAYRSPLQLVSMIKRSHRGHSLIFRDVEKEIPQELLRIVEAHIETPNGQLSFKTFPLQTILHLYIIPIASLRPKDMQKLRTLAREVAKMARQDALSHDHDAYRAFHEFAKEVREKYPYHTAAIKLFDVIDTAVFNATGTHTLPTTLFRKLIDL